MGFGPWAQVFHLSRKYPDGVVPPVELSPLLAEQSSLLRSCHPYWRGCLPSCGAVTPAGGDVFHPTELSPLLAESSFSQSFPFMAPSIFNPFLSSLFLSSSAYLGQSMSLTYFALSI